MHPDTYEPTVFKVRGSSWSSLMDCAHRWEAVQLLGMDLPSSPPAHLGNSIHAGTAVFDQARIDGKPIRAADAVDVVVDALNHPEYDVDWSHEQRLTRKSAERIGVALYSRYCAEIAPQREYTAVELRCKPLRIDIGDGYAIELTGTLDRLRRYPDAREGIADLKSGGCRVDADGEVSAKTDGPQLGHYELIGQHTLGRPIDGPAEIIGLNTAGAGRVGAVTLHDCRSILTGRPGEPGLLHYAAGILKTGMFPPNPRSSLCSPTYCPRWNSCRFHR